MQIKIKGSFIMIPVTIKNALNNDNLVLFLGAGISVGDSTQRGIPTAFTLAKEMKQYFFSETNMDSM